MLPRCSSARSIATGPRRGARAEMEHAYPGERIADPAEVANGVVFLLSDEASFMTGSRS